MPDRPDPVSEQSAAARRAQILTAATEVFAAKGFHRAATKEIARSAGIAEGTIYNYFDSKEDLLLGILHQLNETARRPEHFAAGLEADLHSFLRTYLQERLAVLWSHRAVIQAVLPELLVNPELKRAYYQEALAPSLQVAAAHLQARRAAGELPPLDATLLVRVMAAAVFGLLVLQLMGDAELQQRWQELPGLLADLLAAGLTPGGGGGGD